MAEIVRMPKMSDTMTEGVLAKWHKKVGDKIKTGELVAEVETDKATMEFESYQEGTLLYMGVQEGQSVPVDGVLAILGAPGEDYKPLLEKEASAAPAAAKETKAPKEAAPAAKTEAPAPIAAISTTSKIASTAPVNSNGDGRTKASPLAKKLAEDRGIDINRVSGSGDNGRIIKRDIEAAASGGGAAAKTSFAPQGVESFEEIPVSQMRKTIAKRLAESKFTAPHFYLTIEIDMGALVELREQINKTTETKISFNDLIIKATAISLRQNPKANSAWLGDKIRINHHVNIGVAVAVEEGLLVPVVRFADTKSLSAISAEVKTYGQKARDKKLQPSDWEGNTFTISNLGMFGIEEFTAIINPPDACILAVGAIRDVPVVKNGQVVPGKTMKLTLSCDHRAVDGAVGSAFLQTLKNYLENPISLIGYGNI